MRRGIRRMFAVITAGMILAGCTSDPPDLPIPSAATPSVVRSLRPPPSENEARAALLTADEVPGGGFATMALPSGDTSGSAIGTDLTSCMSAAASRRPTPVATTAAVVTVQAAYQKGGQLSPSIVTESLQVTGGEQATVEALNAMADMLGDCDNFHQQAGGFDVEFTFGELDLAPVGDQSKAFRFTVTAPLGITFHGHVVLVRYADVLITVTVFDQAELDQARTAKIATTALDKARQRLARS